jgi:hypothetical protein
MIFLARPISGSLLGISLVLFILFFISVWRKGKKAQLFEAPKD